MVHLANDLHHGQVNVRRNFWHCLSMDIRLTATSASGRYETLETSAGSQHQRRVQALPERCSGISSIRTFRGWRLMGVKLSRERD